MIQRQVKIVYMQHMLLHHFTANSTHNQLMDAQPVHDPLPAILTGMLGRGCKRKTSAGGSSGLRGCGFLRFVNLPGDFAELVIMADFVLEAKQEAGRGIEFAMPFDKPGG